MPIGSSDAASSRASIDLLETRVVTRPAGKTAPSAGIPEMDSHLADHQQKPVDPSGEAPPQLPGLPPGTSGDRQLARDGPTVASPAPVPAPALAGTDTGAYSRENSIIHQAATSIAYS